MYQVRKEVMNMERCEKRYYIRKPIQINPVMAYYAEQDNISLDVVQILTNRKTDDIRKFLRLQDMSYNDYNEIYGLTVASELIKKKISQGKKFRLLTDYDVDGITSTVIGMKALGYLGADVSYDIPDRHTDGYGLNKRLVEKAMNDNVDVIITFDNGIAACEAVQFAKDNGITVIVTDHHEVPFMEENGEKKYILPNADVIVDPKQPNDTSGFKEICGAMIGFKLAQALIPNLKELPLYDEIVEMAGIATVCDVMPVLNENRKIVSEAFDIINKGCNKAIKKIRELNGLANKKTNTYQIGFVIGPTLNASGRLDSAKESVEFLLEEDDAEISKKGFALRELNEKRKKLTEDGLKKAMDYADEHMSDKILIVPLENTDESVVGIIAGRLKEIYNKPAIVLSINKEKNIAKGSGRSIENYNMFESLSYYKEYFSAFGGHALACGVTIPLENLSFLSEKINMECSLTDDDLVKKIQIDIQIPLHQADEKLVNSISLLEPFGKDNEKPVIADRDVTIKGLRIVGANQNVLNLELVSSKGFNVKGVSFSNIDDIREKIETKYGKGTFESLLRKQSREDVKFSVIYSPDINEWNGVKTRQIIVNELV